MRRRGCRDLAYAAQNSGCRGILARASVSSARPGSFAIETMLNDARSHQREHRRQPGDSSQLQAWQARVLAPSTKANPLSPVLSSTAPGIRSTLENLLEGAELMVHGADKSTVDATGSNAVDAHVPELGIVELPVSNAGGVCGQTRQPIEGVLDDDWEAIVYADLTSSFNYAEYWFRA